MIFLGLLFKEINKLINHIRIDSYQLFGKQCNLWVKIVRSGILYLVGELIYPNQQMLI